MYGTDLTEERRDQSNHALVILDRGHLANAVHAEHGLANVYRRDSKRSRDRGANRRTARHVVAHHECLIRNIILFAKQLKAGIRIHVACIAFL